MSILPKPITRGKLSLEEVLLSRRSCRSFTGDVLSMEEVSQLLWSGQGMTDRRGFRAVPSAGATYPLILYAILPEGVFRYEPENHSLILIKSGDIRRPLARASLEQYFMTQAGVIILISADFRRTTGRYGKRGERYVVLEAGHCAQNIFLQAEALGLGSVAIGAYDDAEVARLVGLSDEEKPLLLVAVGKKRSS